MDSSYYKKYEPLFGFWYIQREIGAGSFGRVFEIRREDFGKTFRAALKAISIPATENELNSLLADGMDEDSVASYCRSLAENVSHEFAIMSDLKGNSNIVSYEDHVVIPWENGVGYDVLIRMELLIPLPDYIAEYGFSGQDVIRLGADVCRALELCQKRAIIHRDIKPSNIFVSANGDFKLGDFGVARTMERTIGAMSQKGTYTYMAPEVYRGEAYDGRADLYSLGVVLYRLLNQNRQPFLPLPPAPITFKEQENAMQRSYSGEPVPPPVHAGPALARAVQMACSARADQRPGTPAEMRALLEACAGEVSGEKILLPRKAERTGENLAEEETGDSRTMSLFAEVTASSENRLDEHTQETMGFSNGTQPRKAEEASGAVRERRAKNDKPKSRGKKIIPAAAAAVLALLIAGGIYAYPRFFATETIYVPVSTTWAVLDNETLGTIYSYCYTWEYVYDAYGNIVEILYYNENGIEVERSAFTYNEDGKPLQGTRYNLVSDGVEPESTQYIYDASGRLTTYLWQSGEREDRRDYTYNEAGELLSETICYSDGTETTTSVVEYRYEYEGNGYRIIGTEQGSPSGTQVIYEFDDQGKFVGQSYGDTAYNWSWAYDTTGRLSLATCALGGRASVLEEYEYQYEEIEVKKGLNLTPDILNKKLFAVEPYAHQFFPTQLNW